MDEPTKVAIRAIISRVMENVIQRRCVDEPFNEEEVLSQNAFGARLVPMEVWKGAKFERSFTSNLGKVIFEQIAKVIAEGTGATAFNQRSTDVRLCTHRIDYVNELLQAQRGQPGQQPDWASEVQQLLTRENNSFQEFQVISDLYILRQDGTEEFYSFKTVKPNLDQTEKAKKDLLFLLADNSAREVYFALPYNPAGEGHPYRDCRHTFPYKIFNMDNDDCVLIGSDLWNKIGGVGTFEELLGVFEEVGHLYYERIRTDYFGIGR